jgi:hypothetical protein
VLFPIAVVAGLYALRALLSAEAFRASLPYLGPILLIAVCIAIGVAVFVFVAFSAAAFFFGQGAMVIELLSGLLDGLPKFARRPRANATGAAPSRWLRIATYLVLGVALLLLVFGGGSIGLAFADRILREPWFQSYHILLWLILVIAVLQVVISRGNFRRLSWEKLGELWLKPPGVAFTVSGALVVADLFTGQQAITSSYANKSLILSIAGVAGAALLVACLLNLVGRSIASDKTKRDPLLWFVPAFLFAFVATAGFFTVAINNAFLTLVVVARST